MQKKNTLADLASLHSGVPGLLEKVETSQGVRIPRNTFYRWIRGEYLPLDTIEKVLALKATCGLSDQEMVAVLRNTLDSTRTGTG
jgi:predicted transcriptional regulator